jgi:hypothetical protein
MSDFTNELEALAADLGAKSMGWERISEEVARLFDEAAEAVGAAARLIEEIEETEQVGSDGGKPCNFDHQGGGPSCCLPYGHEGGRLFKCAGPSCPGLPWPASVVSHSVQCNDEPIRKSGTTERTSP